MLSSTARVESYTDSNVSDRFPVYIILKIRTAKKNLKPVTVKLKPKWDKCDKTAYCRFGNVCENLIFANIREFIVSRIQSPR